MFNKNEINENNILNKEPPDGKAVGRGNQGRIQEFWLGWIFFSKAWGLGAALRLPVGPGQRPVGGPGDEALGSS